MTPERQKVITYKEVLKVEHSAARSEGLKIRPDVKAKNARQGGRPARKNW